MRTFLLLCIALIIFPAYAEENSENGETCRSFIVDHVKNKKYCLLDKDDNIAEYNKELAEKMRIDDFKASQKNNDVVPSQKTQ